MPTHEQQLTLNSEGVKAAVNILDTLGYIIQEMAKHQEVLATKASNKNVIEQLERMNAAREKIKNILKNKKTIAEKELTDFMQQLEDITGLMQTLKLYGMGGAQFKASGPVKGTVKPQAIAGIVDEKTQKANKSGAQTNTALEKSFTIMSEGLKGIQGHAQRLEQNVSPKHVPFWKRLINAVVGFAKTCLGKIKSLLGFKEISQPTDVKHENMQQHLQKQLMQEVQLRHVGPSQSTKEQPSSQRPRSLHQEDRPQNPSGTLLNQIQAQQAKMLEKSKLSKLPEKQPSQRPVDEQPKQGRRSSQVVQPSKVADLKNKFESMTKNDSDRAERKARRSKKGG